MRATIAFHQPVSPAYRHLGLTVPGFSPILLAGQFVMVRPLDGQAPFLPRAFSIYRLAAGRHAPVLEILYKVVGAGTQCLAGLSPGAALEVLGPLGNHFGVPGPREQAILIAGGIGVPPIAALAATRNAQCRVPRAAPRAESREVAVPAPDPRPPAPVLHVFLGGRTAEDILCVKDFEEAGATVHIATEDGSLGTPGLVTQLLEPFLSASRAACCAESREPRADSQDAVLPTPDPRPPTPVLRPPVLYTCGPPGMLRAVAGLAERYRLRCEASVEAAMACGFGACMGCAIAVHGEGPGPHYRLVCKDGPVFDARMIDWTRA